MSRYVPFFLLPAHSVDEGWSLAAPPEWTASALCAQADPDLWFPDKGGFPAEAKRICGRCPVRDECLAQALRDGEKHGIWGGLTYEERRALTSDDSAAAA
jgi:Transcription factor WhiB.